MLNTSVIADSTTSMDLALSDKFSILTMGTTTAGDMLPSTEPMKSAGMMSIPMK